MIACTTYGLQRDSVARGEGFEIERKRAGQRAMYWIRDVLCAESNPTRIQQSQFEKFTIHRCCASEPEVCAVNRTGGAMPQKGSSGCCHGAKPSPGRIKRERYLGNLNLGGKPIRGWALLGGLATTKKAERLSHGHGLV